MNILFQNKIFTEDARDIRKKVSGKLVKVRLLDRKRALWPFSNMGANEFFFYIGGQVHSYNKSVRLNEIWRLLVREGWGYQKELGFPLIISPIGISQQIKHKWFQKRLPLVACGGSVENES